EQAGLAAGLSLYVGHNEKCSVSFDTEHSLKGPGRLLGFHTVCAGPVFFRGASPLPPGCVGAALPRKHVYTYTKAPFNFIKTTFRPVPVRVVLGKVREKSISQNLYLVKCL
ncbi:hypothetical protein, partial [Pseudomonas sp.]|uniref:hypothetical protein n=1 Tax=Pseudomonas sp. TaxID=306 RepID=UPI003D6FD674